MENKFYIWDAFISGKENLLIKLSQSQVNRTLYLGK